MDESVNLLKIVEREADQKTWITDTERRDGLRIEHALGQWVILPTQGAMLSRCPCCRMFLTTTLAAQTVADHEYPLRDATS
jgi:hypothetical protein